MASVVRLLRQLTALADETKAVIGEVLAEFDLTMSSAGLLWALDPDGETPAMRTLAAQLRCDASTVSLAADKLHRAGLIERRTHPSDGRVRALALTRDGVEAWRALSHRLAETSPLAALSSTDRGVLERLLGSIQPS